MTPKCPKPGCESTRFQTSLIEPINYDFKVAAIHCASCGAVVGTMDYYNIGERLNELARALGTRLRD